MSFKEKIRENIPMVSLAIFAAIIFGALVATLLSTLTSVITWQAIIYGTINAILIGTTEYFIGEGFNRRKSRRILYEFIWKNPKRITPEDILRKNRGIVEEGYIEEVYFEDRKEEVTFRKKMQELLSKEKKELIPEQKHILLIGDTSCGKSRMIYQWLKDEQNQRKVSVCMLRADFELPKERMRLVPWRWWRKRVLLLDDLHNLVTRTRFDELIDQWRMKNAIIVATCWTKEYYEKIKDAEKFRIIKLKEFLQIEFKPLKEEVTDEEQELKPNPDYPKFKKFLEKNKAVLEKKLGESHEKRFINYDGNVGSIFLNLAEKERRFRELCDENKDGSIKALSEAIKKLFTFGLYVGDGLFLKENIEALFRKDYPSMDPGIFKTKFDMLYDKVLIYLNDETRIGVDSAYIWRFFEPKTDEKTFLKKMMTVEITKQLTKVFEKKPEAIKLIGVTIAIRLKFLTEQKQDLVKIALNCFEQIKGKIGDENERLFYIALVYHDLNDYQEAISTYKQITKKEPNNPFVWYNKGIVYAEMGEFGEAIRCNKTATDIKPAYQEAWFNMGIAYAKMGKFDEAIRCYQEVTDIKPDNHEAWAYMGSVYAKKGEFGEAIRCYKTATDIKPAYQEAWYNMGIAYAEMGEFGEAIRCYQEVTDIKPDKHEAWYNMGIAYAKMSKFDEAIDCFEKVLTINKDDQNALKNLIFFYSVIKEYNEALAKGKQFRRKWPDRWEGYFFSSLALVLQLSRQELSRQTKAKKKKEAIALLKTAIELNAECKDMTRKYTDFDFLRNDDDFKELVRQD